MDPAERCAALNLLLVVLVLFLLFEALLDLHPLFEPLQVHRLARRRCAWRRGLSLLAEVAGVVVRVAARLACATGTVVRIEAAARQLLLRRGLVVAEAGGTLMAGCLGDRQVAQVELLQFLRADVAAVDAG